LLGGRGFGTWPEDLRYSLVLSDDPGRRRLATLLKARLYGIRNAKVKMSGQSPAGVRLARRVLGSRARLRVDANMAWSYGEAHRAMAPVGREGVEAFEQPLPADDLEGLMKASTTRRRSRS
jgi:L-alanine-DL-glutamate epimerase-like enolase superfamily enzyme